MLGSLLELHCYMWGRLSYFLNVFHKFSNICALTKHFLCPLDPWCVWLCLAVCFPSALLHPPATIPKAQGAFIAKACFMITIMLLILLSRFFIFSVGMSEDGTFEEILELLRKLIESSPHKSVLLLLSLKCPCLCVFDSFRLDKPLPTLIVSLWLTSICFPLSPGCWPATETATLLFITDGPQRGVLSYREVFCCLVVTETTVQTAPGLH